MRRPGNGRKGFGVGVPTLSQGGAIPSQVEKHSPIRVECVAGEEIEARLRPIQPLRSPFNRIVEFR